MDYVIKNKQILKWVDTEHPCPHPHWESIKIIGKDWRNEDKSKWTVMCVEGKGCGKCKKELTESQIKKFYGPLM
jgi:hypothetical protein